MTYRIFILLQTLRARYQGIMYDLLDPNAFTSIFLLWWGISISVVNVNTSILPPRRVKSQFSFVSLRKTDVFISVNIHFEVLSFTAPPYELPGPEHDVLVKSPYFYTKIFLIVIYFRLRGCLKVMGRLKACGQGCVKIGLNPNSWWTNQRNATSDSVTVRVRR